MHQQHRPSMSQAHQAVRELMTRECYSPDPRRPLALVFEPTQLLELADANGLCADEYLAGMSDTGTRGATTGAITRALAGILVRGGVLVTRDGAPFAVARHDLDSDL